MLDLPTKVWLANEIRIWGIAVTGIVGVISFAATWTHSRWQAELATQKEEAAVRLQRESDERIANATAEAAKANARTAEAQLQLEQIKRQVGPRIIPEDVFLKELEGRIAPKIVKIWFSEDAVDGSQLASQLGSLLDKAKWTLSPAMRLSRDDPLLKPSVEGFAAIQSQVVVMGSWSSQDAASPFVTLRGAISKTLGNVMGILQKNVPEGELWIIILPKM
jgi:hypothetical protein